MTRRWLEENRLLLGFVLLSVTSGISAGIMQLVFPLFALSIQIGDGGIGMLRGIGQLGGLLTTLPGGFLIDRFGSRRVYIVSGLAHVAAICLIPFAAGFSVLMLFLVVEGAIGTIRWTALNTAFFERLNAIGLARAGWLRAAMAIGLSFFGPLMGGGFVSSFGFRVDYMMIALFIFVPICLILAQPTGAAPLHPTEEAPRSLQEEFRALLGHRLLLSTALNQSLSMACFNAFSVYIVVLMVKSLHAAPATVSLLVAAQGIAFVLVMLWGGILLRRFSRPALYTACYLLEIAGLLAVGLGNDLWPIGLGSIGVGLGCGLMTTMSYTVLGSMTGRKGKTTAIFYFITGAGIALGPIVGGMLSANFGIGAAFTGFVPLESLVLGYFLCALVRKGERSAFIPAPALAADAVPTANG